MILISEPIQNESKDINQTIQEDDLDLEVDSKDSVSVEKRVPSSDPGSD